MTVEWTTKVTEPIYAWVYEHRFGVDVYLFDEDLTEEEAKEAIEKTQGVEVELDREDEWLNDMGAQPVLSRTAKVGKV